MKRNVKQGMSAFLLIFIALSNLLYLPSCSTISKIDRTGMDIYIDDTNYTKINGKYRNISINQSGQVSKSVYDIIFNYKTFQKRIDNNTATVTIKAINEKKIELCFLHEDSILKRTLLRGKFENGYFSANTKYGIFNPFFPLLWGPANYKKVIGITKNNDLAILDTRNAIMIFLVIPFWGAGGDRCNEYMRLEK
jgi:hypothetical protein